MRIVMIADTHGDYENVSIADGDVFVFAGDISIWDLTGVSNPRKFNDWIVKLPHKHKIVIAGNHDKWLFQTDMARKLELLYNCIYLENSSVDIDGLKFYGSPITPSFNDWFFMADRGENIKKYWDAIPNNTDVLITHGPPMGILDIVPRGGYMFQDHQGCQDLYNRVQILKPKLHIFGHIHENYGMQIDHGIKFVNCSVKDDQYELVNQSFVIDI